MPFTLDKGILGIRGTYRKNGGGRMVDIVMVWLRKGDSRLIRGNSRLRRGNEICVCLGC